VNCPIDNTELRITDRQGIEVDYCPKCRGVWLDRGELDKLIDRAAMAPAAPASVPAEGYERSSVPPLREVPRDYRDNRDRDYRDDDDRYDRRRGRKRSFLDDIFDFD
jgi:Zn-finger nucleic acid-binding protein